MTEEHEIFSAVIWRTESIRSDSLHPVHSTATENESLTLKLSTGNQENESSVGERNNRFLFMIVFRSPKNLPVFSLQRRVAQLHQLEAKSKKNLQATSPSTMDLPRLFLNQCAHVSP